MRLQATSPSPPPFHLFSSFNVSALARHAWLLWAVVAAVVCVMAAARPDHRTLTDLYYSVTHEFLSQGDLYSTTERMNYLPQFCLVYKPFYIIGRPHADVLWRLVSIGLLATGFWLMSRLVSTKDPGKFFFWSSVLALPVCLSAIRNGQANTPLAALMLLSAAALARGFWGRSAVLMMVALAIKQLALPLILLASISHRKLIPWCAGLLPVVVLAPLLFVDADWFLRQVQALGEQTSKQMTVREHRYRFTDINGLIRPLGLKLSTGVYIAVAMAAALALAAYWHIRSRDLAEPLKGLIVLSLAAIYLMLFNPMNESNSYIIAAPPLAILAIRELERARAKWTWLVLIGSLIAIGVLPEALRRVVPDLATWMKPLLILLCFGVVIAIIERERANADPADGGPVNDPSQDSHPTPA